MNNDKAAVIVRRYSIADIEIPYKGPDGETQIRISGLSEHALTYLEGVINQGLEFRRVLARYQ